MEGFTSPNVKITPRSGDTQPVGSMRKTDEGEGTRARGQRSSSRVQTFIPGTRSATALPGLFITKHALKRSNLLFT